VNKSVKFGLKENETIFFLFFIIPFLEKKKRKKDALHIVFTFHSKSLQIEYTTKLTKTIQKEYEGPINKLRRIPRQRHNMLILRGFPKLVNFAHPVVLKKICLQQIQNWGKSILIESQIQLCPALGRRP
jgi:hypothetical protein